MNQKKKSTGVLHVHEFELFNKSKFVYSSTQLTPDRFDPLSTIWTSFGHPFQTQCVDSSMVNQPTYFIRFLFTWLL